MSSLKFLFVFFSLFYFINLLQDRNIFLNRDSIKKPKWTQSIDLKKVEKLKKEFEKRKLSKENNICIPHNPLLIKKVKLYGSCSKFATWNITKKQRSFYGI